MLQSIEEVSRLVRQGDPLLLAGVPQALQQLPAGNWIGGSTPYFMDRDGGVCSQDRVFVNHLPGFATGARIFSHCAATLPGLLNEAPENGFTALILPAGSPVHAAYARDAAGYAGIFLKPVVGWVSGVHVSEAGLRAPQVVNGLTGAWSHTDAVAMHVSLPAGALVELEILNVFQPGSGARLRFPATGFQATTCLVDGKPTLVAEYLLSKHSDTRLPLTADYNGSIINVSIQSIDPGSGIVRFYAPVFEGVDYRLAAPLDDYAKAFESSVHGAGEADFACNCVLNYLYCRLEGRSTGSITGPVTYGEIANLLLNQTLVRLFVRR